MPASGYGTCFVVGLGGWKMVEGHQVHRVAIAHRKRLMNSRFEASSPNGRFAEGAQAVNGQLLRRVEAHGKNLFYFFGGDGGEGEVQDGGDVDRDKRGSSRKKRGRKPVVEEKEDGGSVVVHVHFGMSGQFRVHRPPGPDPTKNTRLKLVNDKLVAHLSAMTCQYGGAELYRSKVAALGPDPLREDAEPELFWRRLQTSVKPVGIMLMDQSAIAGVGNIYRAEILFRAGIHPERPSKSISREEFVRLWSECVLLLQRGVSTGSILTVDPEERLPEPWKRRYIYNHSRCPRCFGPIRSWDMATRTAYACERCQPLGAEHAKADKDGKPKATHDPFVSHCAPEPGYVTVAQLKRRLEALGLATTGRKRELQARLREHETTAAGAEHETTAVVTEQETEAVVTEREMAAVATGHETSVVVIEDDKPATLTAEEMAAAVSVVSSAESAPPPSPPSSNLTVAELRKKLRDRKLPTSGKKAELVLRLNSDYSSKVEESIHPDEAPLPAAGVTSPLETGRKDEQREESLPRPGTAHLSFVASPHEAAAEKRRAGEKANVEHVGLVDQTKEQRDGKPVEENDDTTTAANKKQRELPFRQAKRRRGQAQKT